MLKALFVNIKQLKNKLFLTINVSIPTGQTYTFLIKFPH